MNSTWDFLIIGGSAAGTTAAEMIRSLQPDASIAIITDENHVQYSRVNLPHYIRGKVAREQVFLKKPEWYQEHKIDHVKGVRAQKLEVDSKLIELSNGDKVQFGKLLIAIGGYVVPLKVPGAEKANICYMRTVENADRIIAEAKKAKKGVIVGGGFIGLEFASCFKVNGVEEVTIMVREPYFWSSKLDKDSADLIAEVLTRNGVKIVTNDEIDHLEKNIAVMKSGNRFQADVFGVGIGIRSDFGFLDGSGINIDRAIVTNEYLESNIPGIFAAGDCAQFKDILFERQHTMGNWSNATSQGSVVGKTMGGQKTVFETASSYTISFFDGTCSFLGVTDDDFAESIVKRGSLTDKKITRIFLKKYDSITRVVGATVINNPADVGPLTMLIKGKVDVASHLADLEKADFELKTLL